MNMEISDIDQQVLNEMKSECDINVTETLNLIGGKWKLNLLWAIHDKSKRFNELRRELTGISQKMLTQQLRELEESGLIARRVIPEKPPKVEYSLSEYGHTLEPLFNVLNYWGLRHRVRTIHSHPIHQTKTNKPSQLDS
ncbi:winged helix-turn-helix transcriptional regulator [Paenibacillus sp. GCM10023250]|uniref:winged helix-turn-helix transcriptional regulator n=1 Tax=Paenibacillus sp. GCM10023250 TaxID=3252648 RepID=UPI003613FD87